MKKDDIISYLKILGGLLMVFPLVHAFFALDYGLFKGGIIAACLYVIMMAIAIPMVNYLQYGKFSYWISDKYRAYLKQKWGNY